MRITKQTRREAKELFAACQVNGLLEAAHVRQAVATVIAQKPRSYLPLLEQFMRLVRLDLERHSARVESAVALDPSQEAAVRTRLTARYGAGLDFLFAQEPALIGGMRVQVGSDVYDGSIRARLGVLEEKF